MKTTTFKVPDLILIIRFPFLYIAPAGLKIFFSQIGKLCVTAAFHLTWIYTAEMFPTRYRSLAVGEGSCIARMGSICSPYIIDILVSLFFGCYCIFFAVIVTI